LSSAMQRAKPCCKLWLILGSVWAMEFTLGQMASMYNGCMFAVIPLARQDLLRLRLARSKHLRKQLASKGWRFIRDLDLHEWALESEIVLADLDSLAGLEPLAAQDRTQLSLM